MQESAKGKQARKIYESPVLAKRAPQEMMEFLLHHASLGDAGAQEILKLLPPLAKHNSGE